MNGDPGRAVAGVLNFEARADLVFSEDGACQPGDLEHGSHAGALAVHERAGVPRATAMKLVGHKTESIYRRYAIVAEQDLREGVEKLARLHQATQGSERKSIPIRR